MPKITIDIIGLAVIDADHGTAIFLNDTKPQIVGGDAAGKEAVPAHFAFVAMPMWQHRTQDKIWERFRFYNEVTAKRKFGIRGMHAWYLLSRDKNPAGVLMPQEVQILDVENTGVAPAIESLLSVSGKLVPGSSLQSGVLSGASDLVAGLLDIKGAVISTLPDTANIEVNGEVLPSVQVVRMEYKTGPAPRLVLRRGTDDTVTFELDDDAHLIAGVVPLEEIVGLQYEPAADDLMKHFDLIYKLFGILPETNPPIPKHKVIPGDLGPPGMCGPPVRP